MIRKHTISFKHAFDGLTWALKTQPNYRIHLTLSCIALISGFLLHISYIEFLTIVILIFVGLTVETVNTALEKTSDAISETYNDHIKIAKDVAAGAMLMIATGAFVISCIIFVPKILALFM